MLCVLTLYFLSAPVPASPCQPNPCNNGGACVKGTRRFHCTCRNGYSGKFCEVGKGLMICRIRCDFRFSFFHQLLFYSLTHEPLWRPLCCSSHWLLCGQRRELQGRGQHDRGRDRVPQLALQLHPGQQGGSFLRVLRLWRSGEEQPLQVESNLFSGLQCEFSNSRVPLSLALE